MIKKLCVCMYNVLATHSQPDQTDWYQTKIRLKVSQKDLKKAKLISQKVISVQSASQIEIYSSRLDVRSYSHFHHDAEMEFLSWVAQPLWFALVAGSVAKTVSESEMIIILLREKFIWLFGYQCLSLLLPLPLAQQSHNSQCSLSFIPKSLLWLHLENQHKKIKRK